MLILEDDMGISDGLMVWCGDINLILNRRVGCVDGGDEWFN